MEADLFTALVQPLPTATVAPANPPAEGEPACFYDSTSRATTSCSHCGVLISEPWAAQWGSDTVCLRCLEHLMETKDTRFQRATFLWDNMALLMAVISVELSLSLVLLALAALSTAPAAIGLALWHWNAPRGMGPRSRARLVLAILPSLAIVAAGGLAFYMVWFNRPGRH